jgi:hypothetical protein
MPTVVDAARVTTSPSAVWRICTGCGWLAPLPPEVDRCERCTSGPDTSVDPAAEAWERIYRYAETIGRIQAWVCSNDMHGVTPQVRLAKVREALANLDRELGRECR